MKPEHATFSPHVLDLDVAATVSTIERAIRTQVSDLRRRGAVVGLSGGIDSSVVTALCARALGADRVQVLFMPERDSSSESLRLGRSLTDQLGTPALIENIAPVLAAAGCYERQDEAIKQVFPEYGEGYKNKVTLPSILDSDRLNVSTLTIESPGGERQTRRMPLAAYLQLIAATNFKQRVRKMMEYYHADRLNYVATGTPNRLEYDQGFFVKLGDGSADIKPIAHLYKTQVFALAEYLGVPEEIRRRTPTTDTFSLPQTQEEFYFALPYDKMDLCLYAHNHHIPAEVVAPVVGITPEQVGRVFKDIEQKRRTTRYLHAAPMLVDKVTEVAG
jgi:NAD+ synthase